MNQTPDKIREVISKVISAESAGKQIADERVIARHPDLAGELPDALQSLRSIQSAELQSQAAGAIGQKLDVYSDAELSAPIEWDSSVDDDEPARFAQMKQSIVGYELLEVIGQGGQATVYRARKLSTGGIVAIKVLPGGFFATTRARERFVREAEALVRISHPNVVPVLDKGRTRDGSQFIVMAYIAGLPLDQFLAGEKDSRRIAGMFATIASALQELHRCGIIHRDLKPSNVMVDVHGDPKILDFGLARVAELPGVTDTGQVLGSLPWASPEQASGRLSDVNERSDIYCLGVMLSFILDGKHPYPVTSSPIEMARHICDTPPSVGNGRTLSPLDRVARKCLAKDPAKRYASASELAEQFQRIAEGKPVFAPTISRPYIRVASSLLVPAMLASICWEMSKNWSKDPAADTRAQLQVNPVVRLQSVTNSIGMRFVRIPEGDFVTGSPQDQPGHKHDEEPQAVHIAPSFFLAVTETTQSQYQRVMKVNPSDPKYLGPGLPVQCVSAGDAMEFCKRLSAAEGRKYRLPTEAEWEYACQASPDARALPLPTLESMAWFEQNSDRTLHPVAGLKPNQWGLYDMLGSVSEWCAPTPVEAAAPELSTDSYLMTKGGNFQAPALSCRSAARRPMLKSDKFPNLGFRVVLEALTHSHD